MPAYVNFPINPLRPGEDIDHYLEHVPELDFVAPGGNCDRDDDADGDAAASITLGSGTEEFRLAGFPDWYDEDVILRAAVGVRIGSTTTTLVAVSGPRFTNATL